MDRPIGTSPRAAPADPPRPAIGADCPRFACRCCRTKTGWPHQSWCELSGTAAPDCGDCVYWSEGRQRCLHPALRKGGVRK